LPRVGGSLPAASDKVYQLLAHGRWFSLASSTTETGRHNIAESGVKHQKSNQSIKIYTTWGTKNMQQLI